MGKYTRSKQKKENNITKKIGELNLEGMVEGKESNFEGYLKDLKDNVVDLVHFRGIRRQKNVHDEYQPLFENIKKQIQANNYDGFMKSCRKLAMHHIALSNFHRCAGEGLVWTKNMGYFGNETFNHKFRCIIIPDELKPYNFFRETKLGKEIDEILTIGENEVLKEIPELKKNLQFLQKIDSDEIPADKLELLQSGLYKKAGGRDLAKRTYIQDKYWVKVEEVEWKILKKKPELIDNFIKILNLCQDLGQYYANNIERWGFLSKDVF